jgi:hypothetical protein
MWNRDCMPVIGYPAAVPLQVPVEANLQENAAMIIKDKSGYKVVSEKGKNLGSGYKTRAEAEKRLRQVEYFKR